MDLAIVLDRRHRTALHRQIYDQWRSGILTGRFRPGDRVPSTRRLAAALAVSRSTIAEAWDQLIAEGYLESRHGSGTFVCRELPDRLLAARQRETDHPGAEIRISLSRYGAGLMDHGQPSASDEGMDFRFPVGTPDHAHFPFPLWSRLVARHLRRGTAELFEYSRHSAGYERLRVEIARYVTRMRAVRCSPEQVVIVNGSQQGLDLCARLLVNPGDVVALENPGYPGARWTFSRAGARLRPLAIDAGGIALRDLKRKARLVYVTPSHQYPTGVSMALSRRLALIEWARNCGAVIIEDDYCSEYRYGGAPLPALQGLAQNAAVIYVGTFSKVMFPSLRLGYLILPPPLVSAFTRAKWLADRYAPLLEQAALADFIGEGHLDRHIRRMRRIYASRRQALLDALHRSFGERAHVLGDAAGMHAMIRFDDTGILQRAARNKIALVGADRYYMTRPPGGELLIGFSALDERTIREGIRRLAA